MYKKPLIVFEGIEGTGKSTQIKNTIHYLKKKKYKFIHIREPGGSIESEKIRKLILNRNNNFHPMTDLLLYIAAFKRFCTYVFASSLNSYLSLGTNTNALSFSFCG